MDDENEGQIDQTSDGAGSQDQDSSHQEPQLQVAEQAAGGYGTQGAVGQTQVSAGLDHAYAFHPDAHLDVLGNPALTFTGQDSAQQPEAYVDPGSGPLSPDHHAQWGVQAQGNIAEYHLTPDASIVTQASVGMAQDADTHLTAGLDAHLDATLIHGDSTSPDVHGILGVTGGLDDDLNSGAVTGSAMGYAGIQIQADFDGTGH